jgi:hypothetical protein
MRPARAARDEGVPASPLAWHTRRTLQKSRPTQNKRARERARQERQKFKAERRLEAKQRKANAPETADGVDPDIAGIVPGPQPNPWGDDEEIEDVSE